MDFKNSKEAVEYLKSLEDIIMPSQFTYFNHGASYQSAGIQNDTHNKKVWTSLPVDDFIVKSEMSFRSKELILKDALDYGSVERDAKITYNAPPLTKNFILRVIMPKMRLSQLEMQELGINEEYQKKLQREYQGYDDGRHSKLGNGEQIMIFACSTKDEITGRDIDILYGVREQDAVMYAKKVFDEMQKQRTFPLSINPKTIDELYDNFYGATYCIKKDKDFSRYTATKIIGDGENGPIYGTEFTKEYIFDVQKTITERKEQKKRMVEKSLGVNILDYYTIVDGDKLVNIPKSPSELKNELIMMDYNLDHLYYSKTSSLSNDDRKKLKATLKEVYDDMIKNREASEKNAPKNSDQPVNTSTPPQAIPIKEVVRKPSGATEKSENARVDNNTAFTHRTTHTPDLEKLEKQKQDLMEQKEELINKKAANTTSAPQYDEYGVGISRINEEMARHQQVEQTQKVGRRR